MCNTKVEKKLCGEENRTKQQQQKVKRKAKYHMFSLICGTHGTDTHNLNTLHVDYICLWHESKGETVWGAEREQQEDDL